MAPLCFMSCVPYQSRSMIGQASSDYLVGLHLSSLLATNCSEPHLEVAFPARDPWGRPKKVTIMSITVAAHRRVIGRLGLRIAMPRLEPRLGSDRLSVRSKRKPYLKLAKDRPEKTSLETDCHMRCSSWFRSEDQQHNIVLIFAASARRESPRGLQ